MEEQQIENIIEENQAPQGEQQIESTEATNVAEEQQVEASESQDAVASENMSQVQKDNQAWAMQRQELKAQNQELKELKAQNALLQQFINQQQQQPPAWANQPQPQQEVEDLIDKEVDPDGWQNQQLEKTNKQLQELQNKLSIQEQQSAFAKQEQFYSSQDPEYFAKKAHYINAQVEVAKKTYGNARVTDLQLTQAIEQEYERNALTTIQNGGNPLEAVKIQAEKLGYVSPATQNKPATPRAELNLNQIKENQAKTTGMVGQGSLSAGGSLTYQKWSAMSVADQYQEMHKKGITSFVEMEKRLTNQ